MSDEDTPRRHRSTEANNWDALDERVDGDERLNEERWASHRREHESIARNLGEYKSTSNEWRGSLADLRATFASTASVESLETQLRNGLTELRTLIATEREERREQQAARIGRTAGLSQSAAILLALLAAGGTLVGIVATLLAISQP